MKQIFPLIFILFAPLVFGSESIIEDEAELYELFLTGVISYKEYLELLSLLQKGVDIHTDEIIEPVEPPPPMPYAFKGRLRFKIDNALDDKEGVEFYNHLRLYYGRYTQFYISMRKKREEDEFKPRYRYFKLKDLGPIKGIAFGNYRVYAAERLVIGHRFDGAMVEMELKGCFRPTILYSSPPNGERVAALNFDFFPFGEVKGLIGGGYLTFQDNRIYGVHLKLPIKDIEVFSEWARMDKGGVGFIGGTCLKIEPIEFLASYRNYGRDFNNPYSDGFAEGDDKEEEGIYLKLRYRINHKWKVIGSFNKWRNLSDLIPKSRKILNLHYEPSSKIKFRLLQEYKDKDLDRGGDKEIKRSFLTTFNPLPNLKVSLYVRAKERIGTYARLRLAYKISDSLELEAGIRSKGADIYRRRAPSSIAYYLQWRDELNEDLSLLLRYTNTTYTRKYLSLNPRHEFRFQVDVRW